MEFEKCVYIDGFLKLGHIFCVDTALVKTNKKQALYCPLEHLY